MKLTELLSTELINPDLRANDKLGVLRELVDLLVKNNEALDKESTLRILLEREKLGSTGTGEGIAIPHGKSDTVDELKVCFGRSVAGVDYDSMDGKPAHLFFLLIAPSNSVGTHLSVLARISNLLNDSAVRSALMEADDAAQIFQLIQDNDAEAAGV